MRIRRKSALRTMLPPVRKIRRPASPQEAKQWMRQTAKFLYRYPNASNALRYVALAFRGFLAGRAKLTDALGLKERSETRIGRPAIPADKELAIVRLIIKRIPAVQIVKQVRNVSLRHVQEIRADYRALNRDGPLGDELRELSAMPEATLSPTRRARLHQIEDQLKGRENKIPPYRRRILIQALGEITSAELR